MNKAIFYLGLIGLFLLGYVGDNQYNELQARKKFVLVIDAGHGGDDFGACGLQAREKDITLKIAQRLGKRIRRRCRNVEVIFTRYEDEFISLEDRAGMANYFKADLFLSIHVNASPVRASGTETFIYRGTRSLWSEVIARMIQEEYATQGKRKNRGVKQANFLVLRKTTMPSVLTEVGFISDSEEEQYLLSRKGYKKVTKCIYDAFKVYRKEYLKSKENKSS